VKLSLNIEDADDLGNLGPEPKVKVDVARVQRSATPYFASPFFGAWPGGGTQTRGVVVTVTIGDAGPAFLEPIRTINVGA
jgi:hypothetical protein